MGAGLGANHTSVSTTAPNASSRDRAEASAVRDEAKRRVDLLWSTISLLAPTNAADAFVLAILAHDLARDLADPGFATKEQTAKVMTELRQLIATLAAFLGRSFGTTAAALSLGEWFAEIKADWPPESALHLVSSARCASPKRQAATATVIGTSAS